MAPKTPFLLAALCLLAACQPDNKPVTVSMAPSSEKLAEPSADDKSGPMHYTLSSGIRKALQSRPADGKIVIEVGQSSLSQGMPNLGNPLLIALSADGKPWQVTKRAPVLARDVVFFGATAETEIFKGFTGDIRAIASSSGQPLDLGDPVEDLFSKQASPAPAIWEHNKPTFGSMRRANGLDVTYALYQTSQLGERECVAFLQGTSMVRVRGEICAPIGQKMGKTRAEAIIRGIGIDPIIPIEATPDIATIAAE